MNDGLPRLTKQTGDPLTMETYKQFFEIARKGLDNLEEMEKNCDKKLFHSLVAEELVGICRKIKFFVPNIRLYLLDPSEVHGYTT